MDLAWKRPSRSGQSNCVEVGDDGDRILVRDSKTTDSPILAFTPESWNAFVAGIDEFTGKVLVE